MIDNNEMRWRSIAQLTFVLLAAGSLKAFYSAASVNQLSWILWPTARLTELVTGTGFVFESHAGFLSDDRSFLIAASCSGVNFLITAFVMLSLVKIWRDRARDVQWSYFPAAALVAYLVTIVANTVRITVALWLHHGRPASAWFDADELHRLQGIAVYFGFLLLLFILSGWNSSDPSHGSHRRLLFPLVFYYIATLGVPIAGGAFLNPGFWQHSLFVIATPLLMLALLLLIMRVRSAMFSAFTLSRP
jgi:exosortase K